MVLVLRYFYLLILYHVPCVSINLRTPAQSELQEWTARVRTEVSHILKAQNLRSTHSQSSDLGVCHVTLEH